MLGNIPFMNNRFGMQGTSPSATGGYVMSPGGGLDVMGTLRQQSNIGTSYQSNPGSMPGSQLPMAGWGYGSTGLNRQSGGM